MVERIGAAFVAALAMFGLSGLPATAGSDYGAADCWLSLSPSTVVVGAPFTARLTGAALGASVPFVLDGVEARAVADEPSPTGGGAVATVTLTAPDRPGTYEVTGECGNPTAVATLVVEAAGDFPQGELPATGSASMPLALAALAVTTAGGALLWGLRRHGSGAGRL